MSKVALITGANGMDAKTLSRFLRDKDYKVVLTYRRNSLFNEAKWFEETQLTDFKDKFSFEVCDITDQNSVRSCIKSILLQYGRLDELYMLAAMSHVGMSFTQKEYSILANGQSYYYFLEAISDLTPTTKVYGALTSELFGGVGKGVFNEESPWNPKSPYAIGKNLGGNWIKYYRESDQHKLFSCFGILFNHSNIFRSDDFFVAKLCKGAAEIYLGEKEELVFGNLDFCRDEHWSDFGVEAMWKMLQLDSPEDLVIGSDRTWSGRDYIECAFEYFDLNPKRYIKQSQSLFRPNEVDILQSDSKKAQKKIGWNPSRMTFRDHIGKLCQYHYDKISGNEINLDDYQNSN